MIQELDRHVRILVREHRGLAIRSRRGGDAPTRVQALEYVLENVGHEGVTVRADFRDSSHVRLLWPKEKTISSQLSGDEDALSMDVAIEGMQRRLLVTVVKGLNQRAFVRPHFAIIEGASGSGEQEITDGMCHVEDELLKTARRSSKIFGSVHLDRMSTPRSPFSVVVVNEVRQLCDEVDRLAKLHGTTFVDSSFPPTIESLSGRNTKTTTVESSAKTSVAVTWRHLRQIVDKTWCVVDETPSTAIEWLCTIGGQEGFICALHLLRDLDGWLYRCFGHSLVHGASTSVRDLWERSIICVSLYRNGRERQIVPVDLFVPAISPRGGLAGVWNRCGELFPILLHKAYAKLRGSYSAIAVVPTIDVIRELTGCVVCRVFPGQWSELDVIIELLRAEVTCRNQPFTVAVTFGRLDQHHRAFRIGASKGGDSIVVDDTMASLHEGLQSLSVDATWKDPIRCQLSWPSFINLCPSIYTVHTQHLHNHQRRVIRAVRNGVDTKATAVHFAISTCLASTLFVRVDHVRHTIGMDALQLRIFRLHRGRQLIQVHDLAVESGQEEHGTQLVMMRRISLTAAAGEYIVDVDFCWQNLAIEEASDSIAPSGSVWSKSTVVDNIDLIFRILDQNMDNLLTKSELEEFLQCIESIAILESVSTDRVLTRFANGQTDDGTPGLTCDDLFDLYHELSSSQNATEDTIWRDLCQVLQITQDPLPTQLTVSQLEEIWCVVQAEHDEVIVRVVPATTKQQQ